MGFFSWLKKTKDNYHIDDVCDKKIVKKELQDAQKLGTDLVEASYHCSCSPIEAKYRGRVFSITGKDKRFPRLTNEAYYCGLSFFPFIYGISIPSVTTILDKKVNIIKFRTSPFVDDRTPIEKKNYQIRLQEIEEEKRKAQRKKEYYKLIDLLGEEFMPKSLAAYTKAKKARSPKYIEIKRKAEEYGFTIIDEE